ncbi:MAG TPA: helix-turn-helix transcriptional regulator [Longimicrobium sp.]|nr:helix-turn-helix transcriptional regulator [Longimicrobium sp.]
MRFQLLKPRKDVASAEQVRALRERRGWTVEEMADAVHASALEVSAWETGSVRVPAGPALRIHWHTEVAAWAEALNAEQERTCPWVPENAPELYAQMFGDPAGSWYHESAPVRAHVAGCARCSAVWEQARRTGGFPVEPDTSGSLGARYWDWVDRLPRWAQAPFALAGVPPIAAFGLLMLMGDREAGFGGFVDGLVTGMLFGLITLLLAMGALARVTRRPMAAPLRWLAAGAGGLLGWVVYQGSIDLGDPRLWVAGGTVGFGVALIELMADRARAREAKALAAGIKPEPLPPGIFGVDPAAIRGLMDEWRAHHAAPAGRREPEPGVLDRGAPA